jgi:hypothetical protein
VNHLFSFLGQEVAITLQLMGLRSIKELSLLGEDAFEASSLS